MRDDARMADDPTEPRASIEEPPARDPLADARAALVAPEKKRAGGSVVLLVSLFLFALSFLGDGDVAHVVVLVVVILVHELGHLAGMRLFGFKDLRMFFVPFFGGAAAGRKPGAPAWQRVVVLFLGPVPGLFLGGALAFANAVWPSELLGDAAATMFLVNAFNLVPIAPLDGGRIFELALFKRHRALEAGFSGLCVLAMFALATQGMAILYLVAGFQLLALPFRMKFRRSLDAVAARVPPVAVDPAAVDDATLHELLVEAERLHPQPGVEGLDARLRLARQLWEELAERPLGVVGSIASLLVWAACVAGSVVGAVALVVAQGAADVAPLVEAIERAPSDPAAAQATHDARCAGASVAPTMRDVQCARLAAAVRVARGDVAGAQAILEPVAALEQPDGPIGLAGALEQLLALEGTGAAPERHEGAHREKAAAIYERFGEHEKAAALRAAR